MLLVFYNGSTTWIPPVIYKSSCYVNMADFPFDIQTCSLRFGSWTYDSKKLDLVFLRGGRGFNMEGYVPHSEWEILTHHVERNVLAYSCCDNNNYTDLTFSVTLKRRVTFHMRLILIPAVLLSAMSLAIFWIPANRPDRTSLGKFCCIEKLVCTSFIPFTVTVLWIPPCLLVVTYGRTSRIAMGAQSCDGPSVEKVIDQERRQHSLMLYILVFANLSLKAVLSDGHDYWQYNAATFSSYSKMVIKQVRENYSF